MWQRFSEPARRVVYFAQEEAAAVGDKNVSSPHLLMGLTRDSDTVAAHILNRCGVSRDEVRSLMNKRLLRVEGIRSGDFKLSDRGKRCIDLAYEEARVLNNRHIGTEHLLIGVMRAGGDATAVLVELGLTVERIRHETVSIQTYGKDGPEDNVWPPAPVHMASHYQPNSFDQIPTPEVQHFSILAWIRGLFGRPLPAVASAGQAGPFSVDVATSTAETNAADEPNVPVTLVYLTRQGRKVYAHAGQVAGHSGAAEITPNHLILALVSDEGNLAIQALISLNINLVGIRNEIEQTLTMTASYSGPVPLLSLESSHIMRNAREEAAVRKNRFVGPEHILLGLAPSTDSRSVILSRHGVTYEAVQVAVDDLLQPPADVDPAKAV